MARAAAVRLSSAMSFDLVSIRVISGGSKIASFPHLVKFRFSDSLTEILLWYQWLWVLELYLSHWLTKKKKSIWILQARDSELVGPYFEHCVAFVNLAFLLAGQPASKGRAFSLILLLTTLISCLPLCCVSKQSQPRLDKAWTTL